MGLKRFTVNKFTNQRFTVPGFGTGAAPGPAPVSSYSVMPRSELTSFIVSSFG
jgi:hypothetical protein